MIDYEFHINEILQALKRSTTGRVYLAFNIDEILLKRLFLRKDVSIVYKPSICQPYYQVTLNE